MCVCVFYFLGILYCLRISFASRIFWDPFRTCGSLPARPAAMVGISFACKPTRQPEMDLTIEMPPTFPSKKVSKKPCNFEQVEIMVEMDFDELDLRPFRNSFHSTCLARVGISSETQASVLFRFHGETTILSLGWVSHKGIPRNEMVNPHTILVKMWK